MIEKLFEKQSINVGRYDEYEIMEYLVKEQGFEVAIYGAGENGQVIARMLRDLYQITPDYFIDIQNKGTIDGVQSLLPEEVQGRELDKLCVIISPWMYAQNLYFTQEVDEILHSLKSRCNKYMQFYGGHITDSFKLDWYHFIKKHINDFEETYQLFNDEISKRTYLDFLLIYITGKPYEGITMSEKNKYWGIDDDGSVFMKPIDNEVLLNVGACYGDTIFQFLKLNRPFRKCIGVEASAVSYRRVKKNVDLLDESLATKIQIDNYLLGEGSNTIDALYKDECVSLINMDIEGGELQALESAKEVIINDRPVLSICAYHKKEDLIELPKFINSIVDDYVFVLRKYPSEYFNLHCKDEFYIDYAQQNNELVLYAIPKERYMK